MKLGFWSPAQLEIPVHSWCHLGQNCMSSVTPSVLIGWEGGIIRRSGYGQETEAWGSVLVFCRSAGLSRLHSEATSAVLEQQPSLHHKA